MDDPVERVVCQFSCGAASAVATKLAIEKYGAAVHIVNAFVEEEEEDNRRFLADCERWFGMPIVVLRDEKYGASAFAVWEKNRFIVNRNGAPCSKALKRKVLDAYHQPGDLLVIGYTADSRDAARLDRFIDANADTRVWAPLIEASITKRECYERVNAAGIELPLAYREGFHNANCLCCPKGGMGYWNKIRRVRPANFERMARLQDLLGPGSHFFKPMTKDGPRVSLRMLPPDAGRFEDEQPFECGATCELPDQLSLFDETPTAVAP